MEEEAQDLQSHQSRQQNNALLKWVIKSIPFAVLTINSVSILILNLFGRLEYSGTVCEQNQQYVDHVNKFEILYFVVPEITWILIVIFMLFHAYLHRYCLYSWVCIAALGLLGLWNLIEFFISLGYHQIYAGVIILSGLIFALIKWKKAYSSTL